MLVRFGLIWVAPMKVINCLPVKVEKTITDFQIKKQGDKRKLVEVFNKVKKNL